MIGHEEKIWLILIGFTFVGAFFGETGQSGWALTMTVVFLIMVKGAMVIDHYMEMRYANQRFRNILRAFVILVPLGVIFSHGWGDIIRRLTTIN